MSTTSTSPTSDTYFSGQSTYAAQLNNVIAHAVATATLPITQLQDEQSTLTDQQSEIQTLGSDFEAVQSALDSLNSAVSTNSYSASVQNPSVVSASVSSGALAGSYSLNILSTGSQTTTISDSTTAIADPSSDNISAASSFSLTVDGHNYTLSPSANNLDALVQSINTSGANVEATVINVGGSSDPNYQLSVQSTQYAPDAIQLSAGTTDLLQTLSTGSNVTYQVSGEAATLTNASRSIPLSTGLTAQVLATGTSNITVSQDSSGISSALSSFVTAYNAASTELANNRGQDSGALDGDPLISELQSALDSVANYTSSSTGLTALTSLGVSFNDSGQLEFDQSTFNSASINDVVGFLGSETDGGFLQTAYSTLTGLTDSADGVITQAGNSIGTSITNLATEVSNKQDQVTLLQSNLTTQMEAADTAIATLNSQLSQITDLFAAETLQSQDMNGQG